jgi:hypothetical protein
VFDSISRFSIALAIAIVGTAKPATATLYLELFGTHMGTDLSTAESGPLTYFFANDVPGDMPDVASHEPGAMGTVDYGLVKLYSSAISSCNSIGTSCIDNQAYATATFADTFLATPSNPVLLGRPGLLTFDLDVAGQLAASGLFVADGRATSVLAVKVATSQGQTTHAFIVCGTDSGCTPSVDTTVSLSVPIVWGQPSLVVVEISASSGTHCSGPSCHGSAWVDATHTVSMALTGGTRPSGVPVDFTFETESGSLYEPVPVPEPATALFLAAGMLGLALARSPRRIGGRRPGV